MIVGIGSGEKTDWPFSRPEEPTMTKRSIGWNWSTNGKRAYYNLALEVKGSDGKSFEPLSYHWARDKHSVYCFEKPMRGADRDTFEVLNEVFSKDASRVYFLGGTIKEADPATFTIYPEHPADAGKSYARDKSHVFFQVLTIGKPKIVRDADPQTFRSLGRGYGIDAHSVYFEGYRIKEAQRSEWRMLNGEVYSCDDRTVFCDGVRMPGVDPQAFQVLPDGTFARYKNLFFNRERSISRDAYENELRNLFVFVGPIVRTSVVDSDKREVPECLSIERTLNLGVSMHIQCEKILSKPSYRVDHPPVPGEEFVFYNLVLTPPCSPRELDNLGFGFSLYLQMRRTLPSRRLFPITLATLQSHRQAGGDRFHPRRIVAVAARN